MQVTTKANVQIVDKNTGRALFAPDDALAASVFLAPREVCSGRAFIPSGVSFRVPFGSVATPTGVLLDGEGDFDLLVNAQSSSLAVRRGFIDVDGTTKNASARFFMESPLTGLVVTAKADMFLNFAVWGDQPGASPTPPTAPGFPLPDPGAPAASGKVLSSDGTNYVLAPPEGGDATVDAPARAAAAALGLFSAVVHLYATPSGSDTAGDGSQAAPFATVTRAARVIADAARVNQQMLGNVVIHWPANTPSGSMFFARVPGAALAIIVAAGIDEPPAHSFTLPTGVHPDNPVGGDPLHDCYDYDVGAFTEVVTAGSHWLHFDIPTGSSTVPFAALLDGDDSSSPTLRVEERFDVSEYGVDAQLRPYTSQIVGDPANPTTVSQITIINDNVVGFAGVSVFLSGFIIGGVNDQAAQHSVTLRGITPYPCLFQSAAWIPLDDHFANCSVLSDFAPDCFLGVIGGENVVWHSVVRCQSAFAAAMAEMSLGGVNRAVMFLGGFSAGRAVGGAAFEVEFFRTLGNLTLHGSAVRFGNHGPVSVVGAAPFLIAHHRAYVDSVNVSGGSHGPCLTLSIDAVASPAVATLAGRLTNLDNAGHEIQVDEVVYSLASISPTRGAHGDGPYNLVLTTSDASPHQIAFLQMADGDKRHLAIDAFPTGPGGDASLSRRVLAKRAAGVVTAAIVTPFADTDQGLGGSPTITVADVSGNLGIFLTGVAATSVKWAITINILQGPP